MSLQLIRVNDVTVSVSALHKLVLTQPASEVRLFVSDRAEAFLLAEESPEKATSLYFDLCKLLESTQAQVPFITFGPVTLQLSLITAIHLDGSSIVISMTRYSPEVIRFGSAEEAQKVFEELMTSLGMGTKPDVAEKSEGVIAQDSPKPKKAKKPKPPEQVPR
jgi:hypothetical protein